MPADSYKGETVTGECPNGHRAELPIWSRENDEKGHCVECDRQVVWDTEKWADLPVTAHRP